MKIRVGLGYDVHQLMQGRPCVLGGVKFDSPIGLDGHSDADVLLHAICDAILGAAGLRDIGYHFPNTDQTYKDADSKILLASVISLVSEKGYRVENIDATVISERPKIAPKIDEIKSTISTLCKVEKDAVGIKATTSEKVGFVGREEGIAAHAVALLIKD